MIQSDTKIDYFEQLKKNWVIIVFIAGLIVGWTNLNNKQEELQTQISAQSTRILALEVKYDGLQAQVSNVSGDIKEIKASLSFIKDKISGK